LAVISPAIYARFAETGQISAGFELDRILAFTRDNLGDIIVALLISLVVGVIALIAGMVLCVIGLLFTGFWSSLVQYHLFGQIARRDAARRAASPVIA
jgi:fatty acid desaturase